MRSKTLITTATAAGVLLATAPALAGDAGLYGSSDPTFDGVYRQSLSVLALEASDRKVPASAIKWLKKQQCADGGFDAVWFTEVLEHLVSPVAALRELRRVLRPGGHLFLSTPNSAFWVYRAAGLVGIPPSELQHPGHVQFFSERSLRAALAEAGFTCEAMLGRGVYALLPAPWRKDKAPPAAPEGLIYQDTLTRGSVLMYTRFTRRWISLVADTLMVVARA